jgi:hypothetical protein
MGPNETRVRATLPERKAAIINGASRAAADCFSGFFNGASSTGHVLRDGSLKIGKAECEWDWQQTWPELMRLGLIGWTEEERPNHPDIGGTSRYVHLTITDLGREVREDDNRYFRDLMDAMRADESPTPQSQAGG